MHKNTCKGTFLSVFLRRKPLSTPVAVPCVAVEKVSDVRTQGPVVVAGSVQVYSVHSTQVYTQVIAGLVQLRAPIICALGEYLRIQMKTHTEEIQNMPI